MSATDLTSPGPPLLRSDACSSSWLTRTRQAAECVHRAHLAQPQSPSEPGVTSVSAYVRPVFLPIRVDVRAGCALRPPSLLLSSIPDEILTHHSARPMKDNLQEGRSPSTAVHVSLRALAIKPCHAHLWPVVSRSVFQLPPGAAVPADARSLNQCT